MKPAPLRPRVRVPDGTMMGGASGELLEVIRPRWWDLGRWIAWLRADARAPVLQANRDGTVTLRYFRARRVLKRLR